MKELSHRNPESIIELLIPNSKGMLQDICIWCDATGNELISSEVGSEGGSDEDMHVLIQKGVKDASDREAREGTEERRRENTMTVMISTADLDFVAAPLDRALSGKILGMEVNMVFEGSGVKVLKNGYRARRSGFLGGLRTSSVEIRLEKEGAPLPKESIEMLAEMGANFFIDGPSIERYGLRAEELLIERSVVGSTVAWVDLLAKSDVNIFSRAKLEMA